MNTDLKISICTVCMNRLHQLKQTLIRNIEDNDSYQNVEFVILDYNSKDGMEDWARQNLVPYIKKGKLVYYKTTEPQNWNPSHSKNMAFKLATGDIVCNIWADYFTGKSFADFVNRSYQHDSNIVLTPIDFHKSKGEYHPPGDVLGKVCVKKSDFTKINGFDERMDRHGFEDYDFVNRLEFLKVKRVLIEDLAYLDFLPHNDAERYNTSLTDVESLYVCFVNPSKSDCILFFKNGLFERVVLIDNNFINSENYKSSFSRKKALFKFSVEGDCRSGTWTKSKKEIKLYYQTYELDEILLWDSKLSNYASKLTGQRFYKLESCDVISGLLKFNHFYYTRAIMEENFLRERVIVNKDGWGGGSVFRNFSSNSIAI